MRRTPRAFTLPELLVVLVVIGLIAAMILPQFARVFAVQRKVTCQNNLEKLGQAYGMQCADRRTRNQRGTGLGTREWQANLMGWVSQAKEVFHCPEDDGTGLGKSATLDGYYMDVMPGGNYAGSVCLNESEGEWVWKLSQTQWNTFRDMAAKNGRQTHGYVHPGYVPDDNPNLYYFAFEDMKWNPGADRDFWDINFKVVTNGVDITFTVLNGVTGYTHYLYLGAPGTADRTKIFPKPLSQCNGMSQTVKGNPNSSYGMNSMAGEIQPGQGDKLILMDYQVLLVPGSPRDQNSGDRPEQLAKFWVPDPNSSIGAPEWARHFGQSNMLFANGSVRLAPPRLVDPEDPDTWPKYWNP